MTANSLFDARILEFFKSALRRGQISTGRGIRLLGALAYQRQQAIRRLANARAGLTVPPILIASVTRRCNLDCSGCYSKTLRPEDGRPELSDARFMEIFREALDLGVGTIMLAGGEPFLRPDLLEKVAALPGPLVPVFTNGTLIGEGSLRLFDSGRIVPVFSIEGEASFTAERRGSGIHEAVVERAAMLRERGILFGLSLTLTSRNAAVALSRPFLDWIAELGASALFIVEFVPVSAGTESLALTATQKQALVEPGRFDGLPFPVVKLPGDEEAFGGCMAAGRGFIHVAADGGLEACPFAPFSDSSVAEAGLAEALDSPLMRAIRERHGELLETKGGCALWDKRGWIGSLASCGPLAKEAVPA